MGWINLFTLGIGLGAAGGWWLRGNRSALPSSPVAVTVPAPVPPVTATPAPVTATPVPTGPYPSPPVVTALQKQLQQTQLEQALAQEMAQFQAGFLARTSHELRSPINSVISLHQLILSDLAESPEEEREFVGQAHEAAQKMLAMLDRLIAVAKVVQGREPLMLQSLRLKDVLEEVESLTQLQARNRNLRLEITLPDPELFVRADARWLRQVLVSLIDSPIRLMQEGYIRLNTQAMPELQQVYIELEDDRPAEFWQEPIDLLEQLQLGNTLEQLHPIPVEPGSFKELGKRTLSPGLTLITQQMLLERMDGQLRLISISDQQTVRTKIRCVIPIGTDEADL